MGTTLENGVYLPSEGERNCYAGLKTNWEILDQKVADVTALQQAVAGALHRQIVASLPTTDIDPNTIYMILSGTSATENVYNEFMYVNNAWELIGTSATDLTNYYTKAEVDGKLLLKASASDLTSHTGDTTIHVTTADKATWNTVTSKANDSDVVHKSGNETVSGSKTFLNSPIIYNPDTSVNDYLVLKNSKVIIGSTTDTGSQRVVFQDKNGTPIGSLISSVDSSGWTYTVLEGSSIDSQSNIITRSVRLRVTNTGAALLPSNDNNLLLGSASARWSNVYSVNYYYGSNNVEFSTKFVTTDTNQTISGVKTFSNYLNISNTDTTADTPNIYLRNYKASRETTDTAVQTITFSDKNAKALTLIESRRISNGNTATNILCYNTDANNDTVSGGVAIIKSKTDTNFAPNADNAVTCGRPLAKWSDVQTYKVNALEPSSLSLPSSSGAIDISSYITDLSGTNVNRYTPSVNGYIVIACNSTNVDYIKISNNLDFISIVDNTNNQFASGNLGAWQPCLSGTEVQIRIKASALLSAKFYPCQGNV